MLEPSFPLFATVWFGILAFSYGLVRPFLGLTLLFAGTTTLYVLLPAFFYVEEFKWFPHLITACFGGVLGFWLGFTATSGFSERQLFRLGEQNFDGDRAVRVAVILGLSAAAVLFMTNPTFLQDVSSYESRIAFQGEHGSEAFLLNQIVIAVAVIGLVAIVQRRWFVAVLLSVLGVWWAFFSNHKLSLLTTLAVWFSWWLYEVWQGRATPRAGLIAFSLLPGTLAVLIFYESFRGSDQGDFAVIFEMFLENMASLGQLGIRVADFDGPYRVLITHLENDISPSLLGETYLTQLNVLLPRFLRGEFSDLTEAYAQEHLGFTYMPGMGFAFSPWAEGYTNFGIGGFLIEAALFGIATGALMKLNQSILGSNPLALFFCILCLALFQRSYLVGHLKNIVVYVLPFLGIWDLLETMRVWATHPPGSAGSYVSLRGTKPNDPGNKQHAH